MRRSLSFAMLLLAATASAAPAPLEIRLERPMKCPQCDAVCIRAGRGEP